MKKLLKQNESYLYYLGKVRVFKINLECEDGTFIFLYFIIIFVSFNIF